MTHEIPPQWLILKPVKKIKTLNSVQLHGYFKTEQEAIEAVNIIRNESNK